MIMASPTATISDAVIDRDDTDVSKVRILPKTVGVRKMPADKSYSKINWEPICAAELGLAEWEVHRLRLRSRGRSYLQVSSR